MSNPYNLPEGREPHLSRYIKFIQSRPNRTYEPFKTNKHHILPRVYNGPNLKENIVVLTHREHFIAHLMLWKCYGGKMASAFHLMSHSKMIRIGNHSSTLTAKQFASLREEYTKSLMGHPVSEWSRQRASETHRGKVSERRGKHLSEETKKKLSQAGKGRTPPNKGIPMSQAQRDLLSKIRQELPRSEKQKEALLRLHEKTRVMPRLPMSEETKKRISETKKRKKLQEVLEESTLPVLLDRGEVFHPTSPSAP